MSAVFVVQDQLRMARGGGGLERRFDLSSAEQFGQLRYVLGSNAAPWSPGVVQEAEQELKDYVSGRDHLLLIGNPVLIGLVTALAARRGPVLRFLQWSGREKCYVPVEINLLEEEPQWNR